MKNQNISSKFLRIAIHNKVLKETSIKFADILSKVLGFSFALLTPPDGEFGREITNGTWTGVIGLIQRDEADLSLSAIAISLQRAKVVKFSYPYLMNRFTFATKKAEYRSELTAFIKPFSLQVWLLILACIVTMPLALTLLLKKKVCFQNLVWIMYKSFIGQSIRIRPKKTADYIIMICWLVGTTIVDYSYKALLLSFLTFPSIENISTVPELANAVTKGRYQCTAFSGSLSADILAGSTEHNTRVIGENVKKNNASNDIFAALNDTKSGKNLAFITSDIVLNPLKGKYFVSDDILFPAYFAIPMRKSFCCKKQLDRVIGKMWAGGLFKKLSGDEFFMIFLKNLLRMPESAEGNKERQLSVEDFKGVFFMLVLGYLLSTIIFIFEIIAYKIKI